MDVGLHIHARLAALAAAAGCVDAAAFLGPDQVFPANQTGNTVLLGIASARATGVWRILLAQAAGLAVVAALWGPLGTPALIALVSAAMGVQSAAALRVGVPGATTTFVTGTLTRIATQVADRRQGPREAAPAAAWAA